MESEVKPNENLIFPSSPPATETENTGTFTTSYFILLNQEQS